MAFKSDAHRRWWFANRGSGAGGTAGAVGGGAGPSFSRRDLDAQREAISRQVAEMDEWENQRQREIISRQVAEMDEWERQRGGPVNG